MAGKWSDDPPKGPIYIKDYSWLFEKRPPANPARPGFYTEYNIPAERIDAQTMLNAEISKLTAFLDDLLKLGPDSYEV